MTARSNARACERPSRTSWSPSGRTIQLGSASFEIIGVLAEKGTSGITNQDSVVIANGIYGYEQFLIDPAYFSDPTSSPRPYVAFKPWDYGAFATTFGVALAQTVNTAAALDAALAAAKAANGPALIVAQVDPHDLPAELA